MKANYTFVVGLGNPELTTLEHRLLDVFCRWLNMPIGDVQWVFSFDLTIRLATKEPVTQNNRMLAIGLGADKNELAKASRAFTEIQRGMTEGEIVLVLDPYKVFSGDIRGDGIILLNPCNFYVVKRRLIQLFNSISRSAVSGQK